MRIHGHSSMLAFTSRGQPLSASGTVESAERDRSAERALKTKLLSEAVSVAMGALDDDDN